jgi:hypothetical protein
LYFLNTIVPCEQGNLKIKTHSTTNFVKNFNSRLKMFYRLLFAEKLCFITVIK